MSKARNNLPKYLNKYITKQDYSVYTAIDQAVWRYVMFISVPFYKKHAHPIYLEGLEKTGIPVDHIPHIDTMDQKLDEFGWGAVAVKGFIPPTAFMDMLANRVLAIGVDIRTAKHLMYTPAPDIIHETAGHAPIIADDDYANYLCSYGEISKKAISSKADEDTYEIIRTLSDLKENPNASNDEIAKYESLLLESNKTNGYISEAAELARMNWWTAEYGMIGNLTQELANQSSKLHFAPKLENALSKIDGHRPKKSTAPRNGERMIRQLIRSADGQELRFPLFRKLLSIGRTRHNDIQIDMRFVSRRHAVIAIDDNATRIIDWGSRNGVYVNKKRITEKILKPGDVITIGIVNLRYEERTKH